MYGYIMRTRPRRDKNDKFYVSNDQFSGEFYDDYCGGSAYIMTSDLNKKFFQYSKYYKHHPFSTWLEDIYIGLMSKKMKIRLKKINHVFNCEVIYTKKQKLNFLLNANDSTIFFCENTDFKTLWNIFQAKIR